MYGSISTLKELSGRIGEIQAYQVIVAGNVTGATWISVFKPRPSQPCILLEDLEIDVLQLPDLHIMSK